ncbi:MAG TPA: T9SS type A sorting domain-containing protein [Chitinophagaceae bacterium]|nr:T9SS type A sorting domain-containing protein [Chitinophagaceae bacterium]
MRHLYPKLLRLGILALLTGNVLQLIAQDLPGAAANLQTAPAGTIVIAMDNTNQATSTINPSSGTYLFNLKAYGLVTLLRNAGIYVKWVINTGKAKDGIDFTATAERLYPSYEAPQSLDFRAGPFVVFPSDSLGIDYLVQWFNYSLPDSCKVKVYRTTADVSVDVRYTLSNPPRIALVHDSCDIHRNFLEMASTPTVNYDCLSNASGLIYGCYTIVTEPHVSTTALDAYTRDSIYNFVVSAGGNFLSECEGIETFEGLSRYQSSVGSVIEPVGGGGANSLNNFNNNVYYDNPDMAFGQYEGIFRPRTRGAFQMWRYGSPNTNNFYSVTSCRRFASDDLYYVATASKLTGDLGSMVFYLGNHEYYTYDCHTCTAGNAINEAEINGIRLYLNAVQIPTKIIPCVVLDVTLRDFTARRQANETVLLQWNTVSEINNDFFIIEHSTDGKNFSGIGKQFSNGNTGYSYSFNHTDPGTGVNYYRLRSVDKSGRAEYSSIRKVTFGKNKPVLTMFPNPAKNKTTLMLDVKDGQKLYVKLIDGSGRTVKQQSLSVRSQLAELNIDDVHSGMYVLIAVSEEGDQFKSKLVIR